MRVCSGLIDGQCAGSVSATHPNDDWVVLHAEITGAVPGDVIGFDVSGPESFHVGSVTLDAGGDGTAYVELHVGSLERGDYAVILTRNGEPVAATQFAKRGG